MPSRKLSHNARILKLKSIHHYRSLHRRDGWCLSAGRFWLDNYESARISHFHLLLGLSLCLMMMRRPSTSSETRREETIIIIKIISVITWLVNNSAMILLLRNASFDTNNNHDGCFQVSIYEIHTITVVILVGTWSAAWKIRITELAIDSLTPARCSWSRRDGVTCILHLQNVFSHAIFAPLESCLNSPLFSLIALTIGSENSMQSDKYARPWKRTKHHVRRAPFELQISLSMLLLWKYSVYARNGICVILWCGWHDI